MKDIKKDALVDVLRAHQSDGKLLWTSTPIGRFGTMHVVRLPGLGTEVVASAMDVNNQPYLVTIAISNWES